MLVPLLVVQLAVSAAPAPAAAGAQALFEKGTQHYNDGDFESAIAAFSEITRQEPEDKALLGRAWMWLGLSFFNSGDETSAKRSFASALRIDPALTLPPEAPPSSVPLFSSQKAAVQREAKQKQFDAEQKQLEQQRRELEARQREMDNQRTGPRDVPNAGEHPEPTPDLREASHEGEVEAHASGGPRVPVWVPEVVGGVGAGLAVGAGYFKLSANGKLNDARASPRAEEAAALARSGDSRQHTARALGIAAVGTVAVAVALYLLTQ